MKSRSDLERKKRAREKLKSISKGKLNFLGFCFTAILIFLSANIAYIKAEYGEEYEKKAIVQQVGRNNTSENAITPNRGSILDRNKSSQALAISTTVYNIFIDPVRIFAEDENYQIALINTLSDVLNINREELETSLNENPNSQYKVIMKGVNITTKEAVEKVKLSIETKDGVSEANMKHVYFEEDTQRRYPGGLLAASLIGFVRGGNNWGLEQRYNAELTGVAGRELRVFDENNNAVTEKIAPVKGHTLITTIDLLIQQEAQKLVAQYGEISLAKNASLTVMNPNTGEILAMAEYPSFDLNDPLNIDKINSEYHKSLIYAEPEDKRLDEMYKIHRNFSIIDTYEPGSIYKPLIYAAALEEGILSEHETFYCGGAKTIYDTRIPCWRTSGHGHQNYRQAIATSCNVAVMDVMERLGRERYYEYQSDFGIGSTTGIDFSEPNTERLVHNFEGLKNPVVLQVSGMGQGLNTTTLQMITAFSSLVNGGNLMRPYLVSQVIDENGNVISETAPSVVRKILSRETSEQMKKDMVSTMEEGGTGYKAAIAGYRIGGKTGTGEQGDKSDPDNDDITLSLMTYFPADNPEYVVLSIINLPENYVEGDSQTLPMTKDMINFIIAQKRIPADDSSMVQNSIQDNVITIENYEGWNIAEATKNLNYYGFTYDISGSGDIVRSQFPAAGSKVSKGSKIFLTSQQSEANVDLMLIPNIIGMNIEHAMEIITSTGLVPVVVDNSEENIENDETAEPEMKIVLDQFPKYEIKVPEGTEVLIFIGVEQQP